MPSPIAHSVAGYLLSSLPVFKNTQPQGQLQLDQADSSTLSQTVSSSKKLVIPTINFTVCYGVVVSNLPDLDFLPQLITGARFHRGPTHSLYAAVAISLLLPLLIYLFRRRVQYKKLVVLTFVIYAVHLLMDIITVGGPGMQLFWPLSNAYFKAPFAIFPGVHHSRGFWDASHLVFISVEIIYSLCIAIALRFFSTRGDAMRLP